MVIVALDRPDSTTILTQSAKDERRVEFSFSRSRVLRRKLHVLSSPFGPRILCAYLLSSFKTVFVLNEMLKVTGNKDLSFFLRWYQHSTPWI